MMLKPETSILALVDVQGKLAQRMHQKQALFRNLQTLIRGVQALQVPILWLEQNPAGLGPTIPGLARLLSGLRPISKMSFSAWGCEAFVQQLEASGRRQVILAGIETHVCVYQTAADLRARDYQVEIVADAVSSRTAENKAIALQRLQQLGAGITSVEMVLFELLQVAGTPAFKEVLKLVK